MDYADIKSVMEPIIEKLDHRHLGSGEHCMSYVHPDDVFNGTNFPRVPTSENILIWISEQLPPTFPWMFLELSETCTAKALLLRPQHAIWLPEISVPSTAAEVVDDDIPF